jgi:hypothetical protein
MKPSAILLFAAASFGLGNAAALPESTSPNLHKRACFKSGEDFGSNRVDAYATIRKACDEYFQGTYNKGKEYSKCYNMTKTKSLQLVIGLKGKNAGATRYLSPEECRGGLGSEVDNCSKGGQTTYGNWYYR